MNRTLGALTGLIAVLSLTACTAAIPAQTPTNREDAVVALGKLDQAEVIEVKKDAFSLGDHWSIRVGGEEIATIEGLDLPTFGDTYTVLSPKGGIMGGEEEQILTVAKTAHVFDREQAVTHTLKKEILSLLARYNLEDEEGETVATLEQKFSWGLKANIEDEDGVAWEMKGSLMSIGAKLTLTRRDGDTEVEPLHAVLMAVVASEIYEAEQADNQ